MNKKDTEYENNNIGFDIKYPEEDGGVSNVKIVI